MSAEVVPSYLIGSIPRIFVMPGGKATFRLLTPSSRPADWSVVSLVSSRLQHHVTDGVFEVAVPEDVVDEEAVTLVATYSDGTQDTQEFRIAIQAPAEHRYVARERQQPDDSSTSYHIVIDTLSVEDVVMNHVAAKVRDVHIAGKHLVIDAEDRGNNLYGRLNNHVNIRRLVIEAEYVTISSPLNLPQTNVTIRARRLRFKMGSDGRAGSITTTPKDYVTKAVRPNVGSTGLKAGDVKIIAQYIEVDAGVSPLSLVGGKGQQGHDGEKGTTGKSMLAASIALPPGQLSFCLQQEVIDLLSGVPKVYIDFSYMTCYTITHSGLPDINGSWGVRDWPGDGGPGISAGVPGDGGPGGKLSLGVPAGSFDTGDKFLSPGHKFLLDPLRLLLLVEGGPAGDKGGLDPAPGGDPGTPVTSAWVEFVGYDRLITAWRDVTTAHTAQSGPSTPAPVASAPRGVPGLIEPFADFTEGGWLSSGILKAVVRYAEDLYLAGLVERVIGVAGDYEGVVADAPNVDHPLRVEATRLGALRLQAESGLDYFGQQPGWVPLRPFNDQLDFYKEQIDESIKLLYLSHWLGVRMDKYEHNASDMRVLADEAERSVRNRQQKIADLEHKLTELKESHGTVLGEIDLARQEIQEIEANLRQQAEANSRPRDDNVSSFLKIAATVARVFPVGQPAVGAAGIALDAIASADPSKPLETFLSIRSGIEQLDPNTLSSIRADIHSRLDRLDLKSGQDIKGYIEDVQGQYKELSKSVDEIRRSIQSAQVPRSAVDAELARLKAADPIFAQLARRLTDLNSQKSNFAEMLVSCTASITALLSEIDGDLQAINALNASVNAALSAVDMQLREYLRDMERTTKRALLDIQDLLARAYEYRTLKPFPARFDLGELFERALALAEAGRDAPLSEAEFSTLKGIYKAELQKVVTAAWRDVNNTQPETIELLSIALETDDLRELNENGRMTFNLLDRYLLGPSVEAHRIFAIAIDHIEVDRTSLAGRQTANLQVRFSTSDYGTIKRDNGVYGFAFEPTRWSATADLSVEGPVIVRPAAVSAHADAMMSALLDDNALLSVRPNLERFLPPATADIEIKVDVSPHNLPRPAIKALRLGLKLEVVPASAREVMLVIGHEGGFRPVVSVQPRDRAGRTAGQATAVRYFAEGQTGIRVKAPAMVGNRLFNGWRMPDGTIERRQEIALPLLLREMTIITPIYK